LGQATFRWPHPLDPRCGGAKRVDIVGWLVVMEVCAEAICSCGGDGHGRGVVMLVLLCRIAATRGERT
jgi:hypothetical protein